MPEDMYKLPELARSLRALGTPRDAASVAAHSAIFEPLLDARARAEGADLSTMLGALRGDALAARIEARAVDAAIEKVTELARVRALTACAEEFVEPLRNALLALDAAASVLVTSSSNASGGDTDSPASLEATRAWDAWVERLRAVFTTADAACERIARLIRERDAMPTRTRWFERVPK